MILAETSYSRLKITVWGGGVYDIGINNKQIGGNK